MGISVIIPVYNAEAFLKEAVYSALGITHVRQIILIEDNSPDNCLSVCYELQQQHPDIIEVYTHPGRQQRGAGASRNLGIEKVNQPLLAFLDADDYYLPNRFDYPLEILDQYPGMDYVVSPSQLEPDFISKTGRIRMMGEEANNAAQYLFPALLTERHGYFDTNSIIIRTDSLRRLSKFFDPRLALHQDSELWLRIAYKLKGCAENKTLPGSIVRRHSKNRVTHTNASSLALYWEVVWAEFQKTNIPSQLLQFIHLKRKYYHYLEQRSILSHYYALSMRIFESTVLNPVHKWHDLLEREDFPYMVETTFLEEKEPVLFI